MIAALTSWEVAKMGTSNCSRSEVWQNVFPACHIYQDNVQIPLGRSDVLQSKLKDSATPEKLKDALVSRNYQCDWEYKVFPQK